MSKVIAVFDKPMYCIDCPCCSNCYGDFRCDMLQRDLLPESGTPANVKRPDWCPLRPVPEKKPILRGLTNTAGESKGIATDSRAVGWNACVDKILDE